MLDGYVMNEEISIVSVIIEKVIDADEGFREAEEVDSIDEEVDGVDEEVDLETDDVEGDVEVVVPSGVGGVGGIGSVPFLFGPLTGVPKCAAAIVPAAGPASCASTSGKASIHASTTD